MSLGKYQKERKNGIYTSWGWVPLDNCVTAGVENLTVNFPSSVSIPGTSSGGTSKRKSDPENGICRALVGAAHLDTFLIHEVGTDPGKDFSSKHLLSIHLPSVLQNRCAILRTKWLSLLKPTSIKVLVLCTNLSVYFYNECGSKQLFKFEYTGDDTDLSRCCTTVAATKGHILLGSDHGELHLFNYDPRSGTIVLGKSLKLLSESIVEMCARRNGLLVLGTASGALSVWTLAHGEAKKSTEYVLTKPEPVTCIQLWYPYAIVSYGSGILRMFSLVQRVLIAQIFAHSRWISCMDLSPLGNLLLTIGEDEEVRIWSLRRRQKGEQRSPIKLHSTIQIEDMNLIGGRFLNASGTTIGLANLGSKDVAVYASFDEGKR